MVYSFVHDQGFLIQSDKKIYDDRLYDLRVSLSEHVDEERKSIEDLRRDDSYIDIDVDLYQEDQLNDVFRYLIEDEDRGVYIFDHHSGSLLIGDDALISAAVDWIDYDYSQPETLEDESWTPEKLS